MSMVTLKTEDEIRILREGGKILAKILRALAKVSQPGISAKELDQLAEKMIFEHGAHPAFKGYCPHGAGRSFPATLCVSKNSVVVHGLPQKNVILESGDIVSLDLGIIYKKLITDAAITFGIGRISPQAKKLLKVTQQALEKAIAVCQSGNTIGDIGAAIENSVRRHGFFVIRELSGHGVGYKIHEEPNIPNYGKSRAGIRLEPGMILAIEPMVSAGSPNVLQAEDGSFVTKDGSLACHFEHTVAITKRNPVILTK